MGWYYTRGATQEDTVRLLTQDEPRQEAFAWSNAEQKYLPCGHDSSCKTLQFTVKREGSREVLWTVKEITDWTGADIRKRYRFLGCYLLEAGGDGWGYKPMEESVAPYYYSCPVVYLEMVPEENPGWRQQVRAYHGEEVRS